PCAAREILREPFERRRKAELVEDGRPQLVREATHAFYQIIHHGGGLVQAPAERRGLPEGRSLCRRELQFQRSQSLAQAVVDLARNTGPLVFTNVLLPRGETAQCCARRPQLLLGSLGFRNVAVRPQRAILPAELDSHERQQPGARQT